MSFFIKYANNSCNFNIEENHSALWQFDCAKDERMKVFKLFNRLETIRGECRMCYRLR